MATRTRALVLLTAAELLAMSLWFSASAVAPQLAEAWRLDRSGQAWLTMAVQLGFVAGALLSAIWNLADRMPLHRLIAVSAALGAAANGAIALFADDLATALPLRFLTGMALAGVYPPGMKLMATWTVRNRGLGIGVLVGALTVGSASPHLFGALAGTGTALPWQGVILASSASALVAAALSALWVRSGPALPAARRFDWRFAVAGFRDRATRLANFGYFGHMLELYAVWTWVPVLLLASYADAGWSSTAGRLAGFAVVAAGGLGSVLAGRLADRWGRCRTTVASLTVSGGCCLVAGSLVRSPALLTALGLLWGFAVVADSAQFSAAVSELSDPEHVGTALTVQTSVGFLLTLGTIHSTPVLAEAAGWGWALAFLALGPVGGIASMLALRRLPEAARMAGGNR